MTDVLAVPPGCDQQKDERGECRGEKGVAERELLHGDDWGDDRLERLDVGDQRMGRLRRLSGRHEDWPARRLRHAPGQSHGDALALQLGLRGGESLADLLHLAGFESRHVLGREPAARRLAHEFHLAIERAGGKVFHNSGELALLVDRVGRAGPGADAQGHEIGSDLQRSDMRPGQEQPFHRGKQGDEHDSENGRLEVVALDVTVKAVDADHPGLLQEAPTGARPMLTSITPIVRTLHCDHAV